MKINSILNLSIKNLKRNKSNLLFGFIIIILGITTIVGFSFYKSLLSFWDDSTNKSYDFNLVSIFSGIEDIELIAEDLRENEHVRDVFYYNEFSSVGIFEEYISEKMNGEVRLVGTIPDTKKIIYGEDLSENYGEIICPSNFQPDSMIYYGNYDSANNIDLKNKIGENISFKFIGEFDVSLKLTGVFDSSYDYSSPNICYVSHTTLKNLNRKYQSSISGEIYDAFILFDNIENADSVLGKYKNIEYIPAKTIKKEIGDKVLFVTKVSSVLLTIILFSFCYFLFYRKIIKEYKNIGILKISGYSDVDIKKIFYFENIIILIVSLIFAIVFSKYILSHISLWFFKNDPYLSLMTINIKICVIIIDILLSIIVICISTNLNLKRIDDMDIMEIIYD